MQVKRWCFMTNACCSFCVFSVISTARFWCCFNIHFILVFQNTDLHLTHLQCEASSLVKSATQSASLTWTWCCRSSSSDTLPSTHLLITQNSPRVWCLWTTYDVLHSNKPHRSVNFSVVSLRYWYGPVLTRADSLRCLPQFRRHVPVYAFLEAPGVLVSTLGFKNHLRAYVYGFFSLFFLITARQKPGTLGKIEILKKFWADLKFCRNLGHFWNFLKSSG